jgi:hypothetical protein
VGIGGWSFPATEMLMRSGFLFIAMAQANSCSLEIVQRSFSSSKYLMINGSLRENNLLRVDKRAPKGELDGRPNLLVSV